jgi:hypothetical protein
VDVIAAIARRLLIDETGCLLWTGAHNTGGYGVVWVDGRAQLVHRVVYNLLAGPVPEGLQLDHLCRVRHCASVAHLEPVTNRENGRRGIGPAAVHARQSHCIHGHSEWGIRSDGRRYCKPCRRGYDRRRVSRKKEWTS